MITTTEDSYLAISEPFSRFLGNIRWAPNCEAIETSEGKTLALSLQVRAILKGAFSAEKVPPFDYVLLLLNHLGPDAPEKAWMNRFRSAWTRTKSIRARTQHFGRLVSEICLELPGPAHVGSYEKIHLTLQNRQFSARPFPTEMAEIPPLDPAHLEKRLETILESWPEDRLVHWLKFGTGPTGAGEAIRQKLENLPQKLAAIMQLARESPRLMGAVSLVSILDGALTFPPRRQSPRSLNLGGFAEIATKGDPSRLLISQLALDPDEFMRRYVEGELLYFQKEQPHEKSKPDRFLILDQGIRTWGPVRLALSGAALSIMTRNMARGVHCKAMVTSQKEILDPGIRAPQETVEALEASDFSETPFPCLERVLMDSGPMDNPREMVLLTHERTLLGPELAAITRSIRKQDRLFCLGVNEAGEAELWEFDPVGSRSLSRFRLDLVGAERIRPGSDLQRVLSSIETSTWTGTVEPYPFPFCPGIIGDVQRMGFSADGEWLVLAGRDHILQAVQVDGAKTEVLPRPFLNGKLFYEIEEILGVNDGVVVCGTMEVTPEWVASMKASGSGKSSSSYEERFGTRVEIVSGSNVFRMHFAAHYNRFKKQVRLFPFSPFSTHEQWVAFADLHCIVLVDQSKTMALDLAGTLEDPAWEKPFASERSKEAVQRIQGGKWQTMIIPVVGSKDSSLKSQGKSAFLSLKGNSISLQNTPFAWETFEPSQEGKPALGGQAIDQAQLAGEVLALSLFQSQERKVILFRGPYGEIIQEISYRGSFRGFCLSPGGARIARSIGKSQIAIHETQGERSNLATVLGALLHPNLAIDWSNDPFRITVGISGTRHRFELFEGKLLHSHFRENDKIQKPKEDRFPNGLWNYDPVRFPVQHHAAGSFHLIQDRWGQVLLVSQSGDLIAAFIIRRTSAAVWIPSGVFWGDPVLIGGPPTPQADLLIGSALAHWVKAGDP